MSTEAEESLKLEEEGKKETETKETEAETEKIEEDKDGIEVEIASEENEEAKEKNNETTNESSETVPKPIPPPTEKKELDIEVFLAKRKEMHDKLRSYEASRRESYKSKLNSSKLYWKSFRELMANSVEETQRAVLVVRARILADETYAKHMRGIFENMLEDDGKFISDEKRKKKVAAQRKESKKDAFKLHDSENQARMENAASERKGNLLTQLVDSHEDLAARYEENSKAIKEEVFPELESLSSQLSSEVVVIEALGDAILVDLQTAETELQTNWDQYYSLAAAALNPKLHVSRKAKMWSVTEGDIDPCEIQDVWLAEMQYRMSVAFLSAYWEKCSAELSRIFASMKDAECSRRYRLRELLITFLQRQERLWLALPAVISPVLKDLVSRPMDRPTIEEDVQTSIRLRAQTIQRNTKDSVPTPIHPGLVDVDKADGNFELSSPLVSDLLGKAFVVEKKTTGMMASWKTALAIITKDSFLHLFDIPPSLKVTCGSPPEVAFYALVPPVTAPTPDSIKSSSNIKKWGVNLTPAESLCLPNCRISFKDDGKNSAFEMVETILNTGAAKVFGKISLRKLYLRSLTRVETVAFIDNLSN